MEHLTADQVDLLAAANWQRGAGKRRDFPKPMERPTKESHLKALARARIVTQLKARGEQWRARDRARRRRRKAVLDVS